MNNPKAALDVLNAAGETVGAITLSEITLAKAAILERIKSPLAGGRKLKDITLDDVIPTLFVLAMPSKECRFLIANNKFEATVEAWADSINMSDGMKLIDSLKRIANRLSGVAPEGMVDGDGETPKGDDQKKTTTAG